MSFKTRSNLRFPTSFKLKALNVALFSAALLGNAHAAGLGKLTVHSALGQPLRAEIELTAIVPGELETLRPQLASVDAYRQANIARHSALLSLQFAVESRADGVAVVQVTSSQPLNEPFVDLLLELNSEQGQLVKKYTFLLDPPDAQPVRPAMAATSFGGMDSVAPDTDAASDAAGGRITGPASQAAASSSEPVRSEYTVRKGDTLSKIARRYGEAGVSLDQMLVALYRSNPDAFIDRNMNRLRAGQILSVPLATEAELIDRGEARGVVVAQAADFNAYRRKLAARAAASEGSRADAGRQAASGSITTHVKEEAASETAQDRLQLSNSGKTDAAVAGGVSEEELIARDKAVAEANARVRELEKNVNDLQKLLEIKNQDLAAATSVAADSVSPAESADDPQPKSGDETEEAGADDEKARHEEGAVSETAQAPGTSTSDGDEEGQSSPDGFWERLKNHPMLMPAIGILLAILVALGIYRSRRREEEPAKLFQNTTTTDAPEVDPLFAVAETQETKGNSVFNSDFLPTASALDVPEIDPIAEAEVYIAYGRDEQAEEILKEALLHHPERHAVRIKLLEIYLSRNDVDAFEALATELLGMTRGEGDEWKQAQALGVALDPLNPLYGASVAAIPLSSSVSAADEVKDDHQPEVADAEKGPDVADLEFDLEGFGEGKTGDKVEKPLPESQEASLPPDVAAINFDFIDGGENAARVAEDAKPVKDAQALDEAVAASLAKVNEELPEPGQAGKAAPPADVDLSEISLELDVPEVEPDVVPVLEEVTEESESVSQEMATKLELARAYQDIGDVEGARELLEEVIQGGVAEQAAQARALLAKLS